jgi:hypothetical protein
MPSSKDRRRVELPTTLYDRLKQIAEFEERTVASMVHELLQKGLATYRPTWMPRHFLHRFNEQARRALALSQEEAQALHHNYVGTEHLLLGLLREEEGIAAQVLRQLWIELDKVRAGVVYITSQAAAGKLPGAKATVPDPQAEIGYTPRARKVLALAVDEAQRLGHNYVGTEHLLLGLVAEGEGIAAGLLHTFGALGKVREFTLARLTPPPPAGSVSTAPDERSDAPIAPTA